MFESQQYQYFEDVNWGLLRLWGDRRDKDVLDVGCGFATTSQHIQQLGNRVLGVESSAEAVKIARTRIGEGIEADLQQFATERKWDTISFADVVEPLARPIAVLPHYQAMP